MNLIELYSSLIIIPLENEIKKIKKKKGLFLANSKSIYLNQLENLLQEYYKKFFIIMKQDFDFHEKLISKETDRN